MKPNLIELQNSMLNAIKMQDPSLLKAVRIKAGGKKTPAERIEVYTTNYWLTISESLKDDFPRVYQEMKSKWNHVVEHFMAEYPSKYFGLGEASTNLPEFLSKHFPQLTHTAQVEFATVLSSNCDWSYAIEEQRKNFIPHSELEDTDLATVKLLWNNSIFFTPHQMVFQYDGQPKVLPTTAFDRELAVNSNELDSFQKLLDYLALRPESADTIRDSFEKWARNELVFFVKTSSEK